LQRQPVFPRERVTIVAVLNATPDSFSDGGRFASAQAGPPGGFRLDVAAAARAGQQLVAEGAHLLDVGGESTRPGASEIPVEVEIARTRPLVEALRESTDAVLSIDTRKAAVAEAALTAGAQVVNDVSGLRHDPALADVVARAGATLVLGHMRGTPATMQQAPHYDDTLSEVARELEASLERARAAGIAHAQLVLDPGIGFGKRLEDNLQLIAHAGWLRERFGLPVMLGPSRKSFLGVLTGDPPAARDAASAAVCAVAAFAGADAVRVHDAAGAARAVRIGRALRDARRKELA